VRCAAQQTTTQVDETFPNHQSDHPAEDFEHLGNDNGEADGKRKGSHYAWFAVTRSGPLPPLGVVTGLLAGSAAYLVRRRSSALSRALSLVSHPL
jgi:hypothetical protein